MEAVADAVVHEDAGAGMKRAVLRSADRYSPFVKIVMSIAGALLIFSIIGIVWLKKCNGRVPMPPSARRNAQQAAATGSTAGGAGDSGGGDLDAAGDAVVDDARDIVADAFAGSDEALAEATAEATATLRRRRGSS